MKNFKIFSSAIAMLFCIVAFAQEKTITGIVSDNLGPLPGANVNVKGTTRGTQTDFDGKYSIKAKEGETLVFSFTGYNSKSVKITKATTINVVLDGAVTLSEVVAIGYGSEYDSYSPKRVKGKAAGVQVVANSSSISIRGNNLMKQEVNSYNPNYPSKHDVIAPNIGNEDYGTFVENVFESPKSSPLSTFSIDVDNASYTNIRRFLNYGQQVPKASHLPRVSQYRTWHR